MVRGVELRRCTHTTTSGCLMRTVAREELMSLLSELGEAIETPSCVSGSASFILPARELRLRVLARSPRVTAKKRIACCQQTAQLCHDELLHFGPFTYSTFPSTGNLATTKTIYICHPWDFCGTEALEAISLAWKPTPCHASALPLDTRVSSRVNILHGRDLCMWR
jgi:hypothetical protein